MDMKAHTARLIRFPIENISHPVREGATTLDVIKGRLREALGRLATRLGLPGAMQPIELLDEATGQHIGVTVGTLTVRLSVNGRDFYFDRLTGRYVGAGMSA
jgi:hypothetical protein